MHKFIDILKYELGRLTAERTAIIVRLYNKDIIAYEIKSGYANLEYEVPVNYDTVFPLSSMTKQFTAAVIFLLVEKGYLSYQDNIMHYLPDMPDCGSNIRISHLIYQTSGMMDPYSYCQNNNINTYDISNQGIFKLIKKSKNLLFEPGDKFHYSNSNYILLSLIAERVTNKSFGGLLKELIFDRLDMNNSLLYNDRYVMKNRAYGYKKSSGNKYKTTDINWLSYGDGGILCSLRDLERWYVSLYRGELSSNYNETAFVSGKNNNGDDIGYGFGWFVKKNKAGQIIYHLGGDPGFGSLISLIPEKEIGLIILANLDESWRVFNTVIKKFNDLFAYM